MIFMSLFTSSVQFLSLLLNPRMAASVVRRMETGESNVRHGAAIGCTPFV